MSSQPNIIVKIKADPDEFSLDIAEPATKLSASKRRVDWRDWVEGGYIRRLSTAKFASSGSRKLSDTIKCGLEVAAVTPLVIVLSLLLFPIALLFWLDVRTCVLPSGRRL